MIAGAAKGALHTYKFVSYSLHCSSPQEGPDRVTSILDALREEPRLAGIHLYPQALTPALAAAVGNRAKGVRKRAVWEDGGVSREEMEIDLASLETVSKVHT